MLITALALALVSQAPSPRAGVLRQNQPCTSSMARRMNAISHCWPPCVSPRHWRTANALAGGVSTAALDMGFPLGFSTALDIKSALADSAGQQQRTTFGRSMHED